MSFSLIGSHFNDRNQSEIWSYFLSPSLILPAKFWTFCNLSMLLLLVLLQTVEQYWSLLNTNEFITNKSVFLSRRCLILLIWYNLKRHFEAVSVCEPFTETDQIWSGRSDRNVPFHLTKLFSPEPLICILHDNQTRSGFGLVCATVMHRSIGHVEFSKFQTGIFVEWKANKVFMTRC